MILTTQALIWMALGGLGVSLFGSLGLLTLREFSRHQLDAYCRRRGNKDLFKVIVRDHEVVSLGAEFLQIVGGIVAVGAAMPVYLGEGPWSLLRVASGMGLALLVMLPCLSWIPWAIARVVSAPFVYHTWPLWKGLHAMAAPVTFGVTIVSSIVARLAGRPDPHDEDEEDAFEEEMRTIVSQGLGEGMLEEDAMEMIEGVMDLDETDVADVMTPRSSVDAIEVNTPWDDVVQFVSEVRRTRVPVYEKELDEVVGVLYVKDLLAEMAKPNQQTRRNLTDLLRVPRKVVKTTPLDEMLQDFLRDRSHLAVVVDEFGGVQGVVTIEDVLEEIVGEIDDEKDIEESDIRILDQHTTFALGKTHVSDLNEALGLSLPEDEDFDTIGGYLTRELGRIPQPDDWVVSDGVRITVVDASGKAVKKVRLRREES